MSMTPNSTNNIRNWLSYEANITMLWRVKGIPRIAEFQIFLERIYSYLLEKLFLLCNRSNGIHFFINHKFDEIIYIFRTTKSDSYSDNYITIKDDDVINYFKKELFIKNNLDKDIPQIKELADNNLVSLCNKLNIDKRGIHKRGILISFDYGPYNLGRFLIWGESQFRKSLIEVPINTLTSWIAEWYCSLFN